MISNPQKLLRQDSIAAKCCVLVVVSIMECHHCSISQDYVKLLLFYCVPDVKKTQILSNKIISQI